MNIDEIGKAAERLLGHAVLTPFLNSPLLDAKLGRRVFLKAECLQKTGSFKYRGARNAIAALDDTKRERGVIAFSSGNHAQGIACAAREFGIPAVIVMPSDAPSLKADNTRAYGGEVVLYDRDTEDRAAIGSAIAEERGLTLIKPYDEPMVIAGQGTTGLEIAQQAAERCIDTADVLVCCGGGGLTGGVALALAAHAPGFTVRPAEPEGFDDVARSLASGRIEKNARASGSICDAIVTPSPGDLTFPIMQEHCGPGLAVTDEEALRAMACAFEFFRIVLEPGGAVSLAAALFHATDDRDTIAVVSGGNVDPQMFRRALDHAGEK